MSRATSVFRVVVLLGAIVPVASAFAQSLQGIVVDSTTRAPIDGVGIIVRGPSNLTANLRADANGAFRFNATEPGTYTVELRRLGYRPVVRTGIILDADRTQSIEFRMSPQASALDTVAVRADRSPVTGVTLGREFFRRHMLENKGEFVSHLDIKRSGLSVGEYLGTLPGLRLAGSVPPGMFSVPVGPGQNLISSQAQQCLYGRVDWWWIGNLFVDHSVVSIDELVTVDDIMGVEVYRDLREVPKEWHLDGYFLDGLQIGAPYNVSVVARHARQYEPRADSWAPGTAMPRDLRGLFLTPDIRGTKVKVIPARASCGLVQIWTRLSW